MKFSERFSLILIVIIIVISSVGGGILGNWLFIYAFDRYYNVSDTNSYSNFNPGIVIRNSDRNQVVNNSAQAAAFSANQSLVGIFKKNSVYLPSAKVAQGLIMTSDGWVMTTLEAASLKNNEEFVIIASDKKIYEIDKVISALPEVTFVHIAKGNNFPIQGLISTATLTAGDSVIAAEWQGALEQGLVNHQTIMPLSSETILSKLAVSDINLADNFLFNTNGQIIGFTRAGQSFGIEVVNNILTKLLLKNNLDFSRLGVTYINTGYLPVETTQGALLMSTEQSPAVIAGSPAARAGLRSGDIITIFDNTAIDKTIDLATLLTTYNPGATVPITILRDKETQRLTLTLDKLVL